MLLRVLLRLQMLVWLVSMLGMWKILLDLVQGLFVIIMQNFCLCMLQVLVWFFYIFFIWCVLLQREMNFCRNFGWVCWMLLIQSIMLLFIFSVRLSFFSFCCEVVFGVCLGLSECILWLRVGLLIFMKISFRWCVMYFIRVVLLQFGGEISISRFIRLVCLFLFIVFICLVRLLLMIFRQMLLISLL